MKNMYLFYNDMYGIQDYYVLEEYRLSSNSRVNYKVIGGYSLEDLIGVSYFLYQTNTLGFVVETLHRFKGKTGVWNG